MSLTLVTLKYRLPLWSMMSLTLVVLRYSFVPPTYVCLQPTSHSSLLSPHSSSPSNLRFLLCFYNSSFIETLWVSTCIITFFYFCVWLTLVNIVSSRVTRVTTNGRVSFFGWIVSHRRSHACFLPCSLTDTQACCGLATVNAAAREFRNLLGCCFPCLRMDTQCWGCWPEV